MKKIVIFAVVLLLLTSSLIAGDRPFFPVQQGGKFGSIDTSGKFVWNPSK